jgi:hypothetical protein
MKIDSKARHVIRLTKDVRYCTELLEFVGWGRYSEISLSAVGMAPISFFDDEGTFFGPDLAGVEPLFLLDSVVVRGCQ